MMVIRNETAGDYTAVETLTRRAFYNIYIPGCVEHYLVHCMRGHAVFLPELDFVLELDGQVIGMIGLHMQFHLHHARWIGEIQELVVMPQVRGLKVGSQLLAWAEGVAREAGAELTELSTSVKRTDAHRFYVREGYTQSHFRFTKPL